MFVVYNLIDWVTKILGSIGEFMATPASIARYALNYGSQPDGYATKGTPPLTPSARHPHLT